VEGRSACGGLVSALGAWKSGKTGECLELCLAGTVEEQGKVDEEGITFLSRVCLLFPHFILREVLMLMFSCGI